jgi:hypothetical protein
MEKTRVKIAISFGVVILLLVQGLFIYYTIFFDGSEESRLEGKVIETKNKSVSEKLEEVEEEKEIVEVINQVNSSVNKTNVTEEKFVKTKAIELKLKDVQICGADGGNMLEPDIASCISGKMKRYYPDCVWYCDNWTKQCDSFKNNTVRNCFYKNCDKEDEPIMEKGC